MHKDVVDLVRYTHRKGMVSKINTNGVLLSRDRIHALQEAGLNWCAVSLDSAQREVHDQRRKFPGCYDRAIGGLKMLVECGIPCSITTYVTKQDVYTDHLREIIALGHQLGVSQVRINFSVPMGRFEDRQDLVLTHEEREEIRKLLRDDIVSMEAPRAETTCTAAVTTLTVKANGDVTPCVFVPLPYGNIRTHSLREIWGVMAEFDRMHKPEGHCPYSDPVFRERMWQLDESARIGATQ